MSELFTRRSPRLLIVRLFHTDCLRDFRNLETQYYCTRVNTLHYTRYRNIILYFNQTYGVELYYLLLLTTLPLPSPDRMMKKKTMYTRLCAAGRREGNRHIIIMIIVVY